MLCQSGEVGHHQNGFFLKAAGKGQNLSVIRLHKFKASPSEGPEPFPLGDKALCPPEEGIGVVLLVFHVDCLVVIFRVDNRWQVEPLGIGAGEAGILLRAPLHWRADTVAVAKVEVVPHTDFVPVIEHRRAGQ